ncbi:HAMP domain-containing protein [Streptomyces sp. YC504]|uniref:histidine kinase n=1 Tax=Streptomyces mesophilus TaxID=1775132 RepID=A0A6G4XIB3_9ACTN|nr:ATP-binding protein [Streptomyces mesophilus]NGO76963.1 HAMP domain-containing protein [Streptomyces mesophilus]
MKRPRITLSSRPVKSPRFPGFTHTIRFRLTVLYSALLFALTSLVLGGVYFAVERSGEAHPVTKQFTAQKYIDGRFAYEFQGVKVEEVEAAVNYETLANLRQVSFVVLGGVAVASLGIGWILSGRVLRPVRSISRTAADIQATDLSQRIRLDGPRDELRDLADTVDSMLERLDDAFDAQRRLIDDASHELRSPLAIIRANLDAVLNAEESDEEERRAAVRVVDRATIRMTRLVEDLLATARRQAPALADSDVDLSAAVADACEEFELPAAEGDVVIRRRLPPGLMVIGDHDALRRAVGNLLSNAVRLSPPGSVITVTAGRDDDGRVRTSVTDEGPGIADADREKVFDRFWRASRDAGQRREQGRSGERGQSREPGRDRHAGLGLAIVRQIIESHGGEVRVTSTLGAGATFTLRLPARTDEE